ncbi:MAG: CehA/McbA family metallohydrolase [Armatimonadota bacterium]|nr:CehA/McbA family metallohydrolase [Armatimonadota bacterium]
MLERLLVMALILVSGACAAGQMWVKGNTHTHTTMSDGDSPPEVVVEWYKSHGYNFLVLSDHNKLVDPTQYDTDPADGFILIPGEEVSAESEHKPVHVNGLGIKEVVPPRNRATLVETIQENVDAVLEVGGLPHINHPNFGFAFGHRELEKVQRYNLLEIFNGHPAVHNEGDMARLPVEHVWDILLSSGRDIFGIAVDDAHHFTKFGAGQANPGRGWIVVRVNELSRSDVLKNIRDGNFYASTGVELKDYSANRSAIRVSIKPAAGVRYISRFIGQHGQILREVEGPLAIYRFTGQPCEAYVRAKVIASNGAVAWTQPVRRK